MERGSARIRSIGASARSADSLGGNNYGFRNRTLCECLEIFVWHFRKGPPPRSNDVKAITESGQCQYETGTYEKISTATAIRFANRINFRSHAVIGVRWRSSVRSRHAANPDLVRTSIGATFRHADRIWSAMNRGSSSVHRSVLIAAAIVLIATSDVWAGFLGASAHAAMLRFARMQAQHDAGKPPKPDVRGRTRTRSSSATAAKSRIHITSNFATSPTPPESIFITNAPHRPRGSIPKRWARASPGSITTRTATSTHFS